MEHKKTHVVLDLVLFEEEGGGVVHTGTASECYDWVREQGFGYAVQPMTDVELTIYNNE